MIKTALESKYIRIALAVFAAVLVVGSVLILTVGKERSAMVDDGTFRYSLFAPKNVEILHKSGKYTLIGDGEEYQIVDEKYNLLYRSENEPTMMDKEGYIKTSIDGKSALVDIYKGETVWRAKGEERILNYWDGFWVVEDSVKEDDGIFSSVIYYLLDDNFEIGADGALFNYIDGNDEYITGQHYIEYTYFNIDELEKKKNKFDLDTDNAVYKDGKLYYVSEGHIDHLDGDTAHLSNMTKDRKTHISLLPETLGEEIRGECYEDDR